MQAGPSRVVQEGESIELSDDGDPLDRHLFSTEDVDYEAGLEVAANLKHPDHGLHDGDAAIVLRHRKALAELQPQVIPHHRPKTPRVEREVGDDGSYDLNSLVLASPKTEAESEEIVETTPCLQRKLPEERYFYLNTRAETVKILTSLNPTHRLLSEVFRIFTEEILGYRIVFYVNKNSSTMMDKDQQFELISPCVRQECTELDDQIGSQEIKSPRGMLSVGVSLPPSYLVDSWGLVDMGQLGTATRLSWLMPEKTSLRSDRIWDHWRIFTERDSAEEFAPTTTQMEFIRQKLVDSTGRYFCEESYCSSGIGDLKADRRCSLDLPASGCALLVTDYPVASDLYGTETILKQISVMNMHVAIAFVGDNLEAVQDYLESSYQDSGNSYLLLVQHPTTTSVRYNYTQVKFPTCLNPLTVGERNDMFCSYSPQRIAKIAWKEVQHGAPSLYAFLDSFTLTYNEMVSLLTLYNGMRFENSATTMEQVACKWLKEDVHTFGYKRYEKWSSKANQKQFLYIAGIFPISGIKYTAPELGPVAMMAIEDVNRNSTILKNYNIGLDILDGQCEPDVVMKRFIDIVKTKHLDRFRSTAGLLGPACSDTVEPIAGVSKHFKTMVITYSAEGSISSENNKDYPYFFRTIAENKQYKYAYMATLKRLKWKKVAALSQDGQQYTGYMSGMQDEFQKNDITFVMNRKFPKDAVDLSLYLNDLKDRGAKIIIGDFYYKTARNVMCQAYKLKMTQREGYVWFLPGWYKENWYDIDRYRSKPMDGEHNDTLSLGQDGNATALEGEEIQGETFLSGNYNTKYEDLPNCTTEQMKRALNGHLTLGHANYAPDDHIMQTNNTISEWKEKVKTRLDASMRDYRNQTRKAKNRFYYDTEGEPNKYSGYVYDAVWLYAIALDTLIKQNKSYIQNLHSDRTVDELVKIIKNVDFSGVTGRINFYNRNSRLSKIKIRQWYMDPSDTNDTRPVYTHEIGEYEPNYSGTNGSDGQESLGKLVSWNESQIKWQTVDGSKPADDNKECGILSHFANSLNLECQLAITVAFIIGFGLVLFIILIAFLLLKRRFEMKMRAQEDRMRALGLLEPMSALQLDEWEIPRDRVVINRKLGEGAFGTVCGGECFFDDRGWVAVAVKTLKIGSSHEIKLDFLSEAEMMKRFDHKNIVKLLGVVTRSEPVYTVMEYMLYGDLKTYLLARRHLVNERNREELDEVSNRRLTSMALDIAKGLAYLADLKYVHRDIACRNCLVNASRTVKLADFGMTRAMFESDYYRFSRKGMLPVRWMSPESLSDGIFTPMSDIWSYGVLLYEIITFGSFPFQGLSNNQVLEHVKSGNTLSIPSGIKPQLKMLLKSCFDITPTKRPTAQEIVELLGNTPRLICPCIDVPLASVQIERTDSLELIPNVRASAPSQAKKNGVSNRLKDNSPSMNFTNSQSNHLNSNRDESDNGYGSGAYSPMHVTTQNGGHANTMEMVSVEEPLLSDTDHPNSYVPPGYIMLDHSTKNCDYSDYMPNRIASV